MHRRVILVLAAVCLLAAPLYASHSWGGYHWARTANPFVLKVHDNIDPVWEPYLTQAVSDWNRSTVFDFNVQWGQPISTQRRCTSTSGRVEICNLKYGQNGWLGIAGISISGSHITKGYTKLNDTYYASATYNTPAWRQMVVCQEIAHDIGLDHQDETFDNANLGSCMDYTNDPDGGAGGAVSNDPSNTGPNQHDYDQIALIYAHLDSSTTLSSIFDVMTAAVSRPQTVQEMLNDAEQWGAPIRFDSLGRPNVFAMPVGINEQTGEEEYQLTHVFWVPDWTPVGRERPADPVK